MKREIKNEFNLSDIEHQVSLLFGYIKNNDLKKVKEFLVGMDQNIMLICDEYIDQDPLMYALSLKHIEIAKILIPYAELSLQDKKGATIWHAAVDEDNSPNIKIVESLIKVGVDINSQDICGNTALHSLINNNTSNIEIIKLLIEAGIDVNLLNTPGFTALQGAVYDNNIEIVKALIEAGAHLDYTLPDNGFTALHIAVFKGYTEIAQTLIKAGANVNLTDKNGHTALGLAVFNNNIKIVEALIEAGNLLVSKNEYIKMIDDFNINVKNKDEKYIEGVVSCFVALIKSNSVYENHTDIVKSFRSSSTIHKPENALFKQKLFKKIIEETKKYLDIIVEVEGEIQHCFYGENISTSKYVTLINKVKEDKDLSEDKKSEIIEKIIKELQVSLTSLLQIKENGLNHIAVSILGAENQAKEQNDDFKLKKIKALANSIYELNNYCFINKNLCEASFKMTREYQNYTENKIIVPSIRFRDIDSVKKHENDKFLKLLKSLDLNGNQYFVASNNDSMDQNDSSLMNEDDPSFNVVIGDNTQQENID